MLSNSLTQWVDPEPGGLGYRVRPGAGPGPQAAVILLHGRSGDENVMWIFARALPPDWLVVAPRAPQADPEGGYSWHPRQPGECPDLDHFDPGVRAVWGLAEALPGRHQADLQRLYLMGFSQGAALAFAAALARPAAVRGVAGLVGFLPAGPLPAGRLAGLPVFMAAGRQDARVPLEVARAGAAGLRAAGAELDYREYDTGHKLDAQGMRDLTAWWSSR